MPMRSLVGIEREGLERGFETTIVCNCEQFLRQSNHEFPPVIFKHNNSSKQAEKEYFDLLGNGCLLGSLG